MNTYTLTITHLFAKTMNIYGDFGNVITLQRRCEWRGIEVVYTQVNNVADFSLIGSGDIYFFGGGQDNDQMLVWNEISKQKEVFIQKIEQEVMNNKIFLLICGGYQLFGKRFLDSKGNTISGLGILDIETHSPGDLVSQRCIGNIVIDTSLPISPKTIVGFENHGGQTKLSSQNPHICSLGSVIKGFGNNLKDKHEGCRYKNVIASYMHGSLLPKNPHLSDYIITEALRVKYGGTVTLTPLDDTIEWEAHHIALNR